MSLAGHAPISSERLRMLRIVRWLLPLGLAAAALAFEAYEHSQSEAGELSTGIIGDIGLFAVAGPLAVAITMGWVVQLVNAYQALAAELEATNRDLEDRIADRTRSLSATSEQLSAANAELATANEELRQLDRLKSEFVSLVSHQLRAPLTNINGALEIVAEDASKLPARSQRTLQILTSEARHLSRLVQTILDVSRLEAGRLGLHLGPLALQPLLANACAATLGADPDRRWILTVPDALPPAWADELLLDEVVRNILENATQYSPVGAEVAVAAVERENVLEISVTDHGPGVPPEEQARIFESFHRLGDEGSAVKGSGLGLYLADRLISAQGGTIGVRSPIWPDAAAPGARFTVSLPVAPDVPEEAPTPASPATAQEARTWHAS